MEGNSQKAAFRGAVNRKIEYFSRLKCSINDPLDPSVGLLQYQDVARGNKGHARRLAEPGDDTIDP